MSLKLLTDQGNPFAWKILIAAKYAGVQIETPRFEMGVDNKTPEFEKKTPTGKVPVLETSEGILFQANAAARYVASLSKKSLLGSTNFETAQVDNWIDYSVNEIDLPASVWIFPILGFIQNNQMATQRAKGDIRKVLDTLNQHLANRTFLVGERISLGDIVIATSLHRLYEKVLEPAFRQPFVNTDRWFTTVVNQPEYIAVAGTISLCTKMEVAKNDLPVEGAAPKSEKAEKPKKEPKPKQEKPKEEKKEEKKEEAKPKQEDETQDVDDDGVPVEPKKKSLLDSLPPSKMNLDEWKRTYSNEDTRSKALPWLWQNFDKEGYSFWTCDYKYNNELQKLFMTANLVSGFLQRLDKLRKYAFGTMIIFGENDSNEISGIWMFRGQNIPEEMGECDDAEHFHWKKVDFDDPQTRELIGDFFSWDKFTGRTKTFVEGKVYK